MEPEYCDPHRDCASLPLPRPQGVPVGAPYYIVNLGPVINKQYQWAVVSDPIGVSVHRRDGIGTCACFVKAGAAFAGATVKFVASRRSPPPMPRPYLLCPAPHPPALQLSLFILARNVTDFYDNYQQGVLDWCKANGFTNPLNAPLATQQIGCKPW